MLLKERDCFTSGTELQVSISVVVVIFIIVGPTASWLASRALFVNDMLGDAVLIVFSLSGCVVVQVIVRSVSAALSVIQGWIGEVYAISAALIAIIPMVGDSIAS